MKKILDKLLTLILAIAASLFVCTFFIYDKHDKSPTAENTSSIVTSPTAVPAAPSAAVTPEGAKEIALHHAGADSGSAVFSKEKLDKGVYELKFSDPYGKYEYTISADDGAILDFQWDIQNPRSAIPLELAEEIALNHAGVDSDNVSFTKEKLDETVYELQFSDGNGKYEYEISAADGMILDYKRDVTPAMPAPGEPEDDAVQEGAVSKEEACQIALDDADVEETALKYLVCYVSWTDHVPTAYEVKFATRQASYHYTIALDTGAVLGSVCHPHH